MIDRVNRRADAMWKIIFPKLFGLATAAGKPTLDGVDIVDLGSGYGDFALKALIDGVSHVTLVDNNSDNLDYAGKRLRGAGIAGDRFRLCLADLNKEEHVRRIYSPAGFYVAFCFSVLPYLYNPHRVMADMNDYCNYSFIECQYAGDGPGFADIEDDADMAALLLEHWEQAIPIGHTHLDIRPVSRTIWFCAGWPNND